MDAHTILRIKPSLTRYLHEFDGCFGRSNTRAHLSTYVSGQLSDLHRKSLEPMADAAGMPPRTLQEFLGLSRWDETMMRDRLQQRVARRHPHGQSVGVIDETSFVKKGDMTACVQRQHCGSMGKQENCVVSVHLGYATPPFHSLLDGDLYLPEKTWHQDRDRCHAAGIPDEVVYRPKWRIALEQYQRAVDNGVRFGWLTFDEYYGSKPPFLRELDHAGQDYVAEVPKSTHVWTQEPQVLHRSHARDLKKTGRPRQYPRLKVKNNPTASVENIVKHSPLMYRQSWVDYHVKDGSKGPMVWQVKHLLVYLKDKDGLPTRAHHLLVTRNPLDPTQIKYFISNATPSTRIQTLLWVAFSRWKIERMFQDSKMQLGMDHFEVRKYQSIQRHLILSCVSHLFLAEFGQQHRKKKSPADDQPSRHRGDEAGADLVAWRPLFIASGTGHQRPAAYDSTTQPQSRSKPSQANHSESTRQRHQIERPTKMSMADNLAL